MAQETTNSKKHYSKGLQIGVFLLAVAAGLFLFYIRSANKNNAPSSSTPTPTVTQTNSNSDLSSKTWVWTKTQMSDGSVTVPSSEGKFTAAFQKDGRLVAHTDCNTGNGGYTLGADNSLAISPMATTMMFCEGSNENAYFQQLQNVGSYKISDGQLWLMIKKDSGTMIFK